jgi:hypothetical protein
MVLIPTQVQAIAMGEAQHATTVQIGCQPRALAALFTCHDPASAQPGDAIQN